MTLEYLGKAGPFWRKYRSDEALNRCCLADFSSLIRVVGAT